MEILILIFIKINALLYDMYVSFQNAYYGKEIEPVLKKGEYIQHAPLIVLDCSKQNQSLQQAPVDFRLEFEAKENFPAQTPAYCLILHDRIIEYNSAYKGLSFQNCNV